MATTMREAPQSNSLFLSLPLELVIETIAHLEGDRNSLCNLARTCRLLHPLAEEQIYRTIELENTDDLAIICNAFDQRARRVEAVHTLKILYKYHEKLAETVQDRATLNQAVFKMNALQEWYIESPFDNFKWGDAGGAEWVHNDMDVFRQAIERASLHRGQPKLEDVGLAKLQKLTIHSHGAEADFWSLGEYHCLFRHPALRYLHISCVLFPKDLPELEPYARTTPLTTLIFDECELEPESLCRILSTPKSLKHLTLGENVHNIRKRFGPSPRLSSNPDAAMQALLPVADTLETLTHLDPTWATKRHLQRLAPIRLQGDGMRDFHHLKFVQCDPFSFLHRGILTVHTLAPPNIETIRLHHYSKQHESFFDELPDVTPYTYLGSLKVLELVQPMPMDHPTAFNSEAVDMVCQPDALQERHTFAYNLHKCGVTTRLYAEMHNCLGLQNYIPPYLHGERLPQFLSVYDSEEIGFQRSGDEDSVDIDSEEKLNTQSQLMVDRMALHYRLNKPLRERSEAAPNKFFARRSPTEGQETDKLSTREKGLIRNKVYYSMFEYMMNFLREAGYEAEIRQIEEESGEDLNGVWGEMAEGMYVVYQGLEVIDDTDSGESDSGEETGEDYVDEDGEGGEDEDEHEVDENEHGMISVGLYEDMEDGDGELD